ncbi:ABCB family ABC transporter ATP-binding protein/permease [Cohaesibacter celericrescens]|uniref:Metal ABC transporter permease n=1 Tax=Cohaesibacter celericrescens TaxID=2067669 RepID=A0A2N5XSE7_9HYPH|nr:ABC transporter ATP-binding protein/permease [Cohaesibacter celericrescens]PLW77380.1 metal ABC transporter permease [Cohaesibacter celericrescens]
MVQTPPIAKPAGTKAKSVDAEASAFGTLRNLWPYIWPTNRSDLKTRVAVAMIAMVFGKAVNVLTPYLFKWSTDSLTQPNAADGVGMIAWLSIPIMLVAAYGVGRILNVGFDQMRDALFARVGQYAVRNLSNETFRHMHNLSLRFHLQRRTGGLSRIIERGTKGIESVVRHTILNAFPTLLQFIFMAIVIAYEFDFVYLLVVVVMVVVFVVFSAKVSSWRIDIRRKMNESDNDAHSKAVDSLLNFETVKYFGNEEREATRFDKSMAVYEKNAIRTWVSLAWLNFGQITVFSIGMAVCMALSARAVIDGTQTVGDFVLINALLMQLFIPLNFFGFMHREIKQGLVDLEAMFELMRQPAEVIDKTDAAPLAVSGGAVRFDNVSFHYDADRPILKGVSFEVPAGKTVAIVGPSGAGKSTISRLLFRFYDVTDGSITIDGQDLRDVQQQSLRHNIGMVPQDTVLFNDTLLYNIGYGRPDAEQSEIVEAARLAQVSDFIASLPAGFQTEVGERGLKLSGGEKQRVAIARTILKAPPILVLDEATSALDSHTEQEIQTALDEVSQNRTTVVIAHRLSTVIGADEIIVLEAGKIRERGRHADLLEQGGLYASMWDRQREASEAQERLRQAMQGDEFGFLPSHDREIEKID